MYVNLFLKREKGEKGVILQNKFPTPIVFKKPHKVGVVAVSLSSKIDNSPIERGFIISKTDGTDQEVLLFTRKHWTNIKGIAAELRKLIKETIYNGVVNVIVHEKTQLRWTLPNNIEFRFSNELGRYLGIKGGKITGKDATTIYSTPNLKSGFSRIYIQSKYIFPSQHFRDQYSRILDSFDYSYEHDIISRRFPFPIYHSLNQKRLEEITLYFTDEYGRLVTMDDAHTWVLIHIKPDEEEKILN